MQLARKWVNTNLNHKKLITYTVDLLSGGLPLSAFALWFTSLKGINVRLMNDLGLVSVMPPATILSLVILCLSFCLTLWRPKQRVLVILLHFLCLIFMLYSITVLVEEEPRFAVVYRHEGYTDYILRHGNVNPGLDAYFNWPGFFAFTAFFAQIIGLRNTLGFAEWSPVYLNLLYLAPLYVIITTATTERRLTWLTLWFFSLANWIGQDYFSPQGLNFFFYLVIIAILLKWFKEPQPASTKSLRWLGSWPFLQRFRFTRSLLAWATAPDALITSASPRLYWMLLVLISAIFAFVVFSHPLTPMLVIMSVTALVVLRRCRPLWLPVVMGVMTVGWLVVMAQPYLVGHLDTLLGDLRHLGQSLSHNVTERASQGSPEHTFITQSRMVMTLLIWGLALVGGGLRLRKGYRDVTYVLLALALFPILLVQSYGGEMLMRIYLFTLPLMVFFAASIFYLRSPGIWMKGLMVFTCLVLLAGFLFTRYGNERMDYMTTAEITAVHHLYAVAPSGSLLIAAWEGTPWQAERYEQYRHLSLGALAPEVVTKQDVKALVRSIEGEPSQHAYLIVTRSQRATAELYGFPPGFLDRFIATVLASQKFRLIYNNQDAEIYKFVQSS
jgi:hypothetical protein